MGSGGEEEDPTVFHVPFSTLITGQIEDKDGRCLFFDSLFLLIFKILYTDSFLQGNLGAFCGSKYSLVIYLFRKVPSFCLLPAFFIPSPSSILLFLTDQQHHTGVRHYLLIQLFSALFPSNLFMSHLIFPLFVLVLSKPTSGLLPLPPPPLLLSLLVLCLLLLLLQLLRTPPLLPLTLLLFILPG